MIKLNSLLILVLSFCSVTVFAQKPISDKQHKNNIDQSKIQSVALLSRDTLYCNGNAQSIVKYYNGAESISDGAFVMSRISPLDTIVVIEKKSYSVAQGPKAFKIVYYFQVDFPTLQLSCDVRESDNFAMVFNQFCKYNVFNQLGLDTNNVFLFTTLKGKIPPSEITGRPGLRDTVLMMRSIKAVRNTQAPINITDENIYQDGVMFASFVADSLIGQSGLLRHFQIYNSKGVLICTATESKYLSHEWRLLTYKDNRFHSLNVPTEDDLMQILKSLISKDYL